MKDFVGQELAIGDYVAFSRTTYRDLVLGKIVAFTPKQVRISFKHKRIVGETDTTLNYSANVVKLEPNDVLVKLLKGD